MFQIVTVNISKNNNVKYSSDINISFYAVEDRIPRVHPWMNELYLVSALAEVRSAPQELSTLKTPGLARGYLC
jgi:hypothetical protein